MVKTKDRSGDVAQWEEVCLARTKLWGRSPSSQTGHGGVGLQPQEMGESEIQGHLKLHHEFQASLGNSRLSLKQTQPKRRMQEVT